jgi:hypothetical protein
MASTRTGQCPRTHAEILALATTFILLGSWVAPVLAEDQERDRRTGHRQRRRPHHLQPRCLGSRRGCTRCLAGQPGGPESTPARTRHPMARLRGAGTPERCLETTNTRQDTPITGGEVIQNAANANFATTPSPCASAGVRRGAWGATRAPSRDCSLRPPCPSRSSRSRPSSAAENPARSLSTEQCVALFIRQSCQGGAPHPRRMSIGHVRWPVDCLRRSSGLFSSQIKQ